MLGALGSELIAGETAWNIRVLKSAERFADTDELEVPSGLVSIQAVLRVYAEDSSAPTNQIIQELKIDCCIIIGK